MSRHWEQETSPINLTDAQRQAIEHIHAQHEIDIPLQTYMGFAQPQIGFNDGSVIIDAKGMWIGIEADGSRHT